MALLGNNLDYHTLSSCKLLSAKEVNRLGAQIYLRRKGHNGLFILTEITPNSYIVPQKISIGPKLYK
jgi:hypothetical protein